ncbi:primosomal protein N' [Alkalimarinus alittae]|uniref:Replication restart protein PriA n=1 Tax=Alkalimarinus alittae TaxID=2961619 RepID=A0ABY6N154_9ALTE|nr:primosomal protein N' [Alkalimarinus alittae]UZE95734.1 primosomal protein N' [Alkalimarinus alittae]
MPSISPTANSITILAVALPIPLYRTFDYLPPLEINVATLEPGQRVAVQFGRRALTGIIIEIKDHSDFPIKKLKPVKQLLDQQPILSPSILSMAKWASQYYCHPIGEVLFAILPPILKQGQPINIAGTQRWSINKDHIEPAENAIKPNAKKQLQLYRALENAPNGLLEETIKLLGFTSTQLKSLFNKALIVSEELDALTAAATEYQASAPPLPLSEDQTVAVKQLASDIGNFQCTLLQGVTGSGKTEVYMNLVDQVISAGRQAIILVPEISLTPQTLARFQRHFKCPIGTLHSGLNQNERLTSWELARQGAAKIIIGTRSAIFTPMKNLGCIIVDEEHDNSFKQQEGFRYSARDLAVTRGHKEKCPVVLGSATPSLESINNVLNGKYKKIALPSRAGGASFPDIELLDIKSRPLEGGLSRPLIDTIKQHLDNQHQVIVYLNRRGFAPAITCEDCGWLADCRHCDARMTLHKHPAHLRCHHCDYSAAIPSQCPDCQSTNIKTLGAGTEKAEETLEAIFPETPIIRVDRDSTRKKNAMKDLVEEVNKGNPCILVGTQMLAKGHDFANVTLVAVVDADGGLFSADFRALEKTAQLLIQVAGRSGRGSSKGQVVIQTSHGDHPILQQIARGNYPQIADELIDERQSAALPPFSYMSLLKAEAPHINNAIGLLEKTKKMVADMALDPQQTVELLGPIPASMSRKAGVHRAHLLLSSENRVALQRITQHICHWLNDNRWGKTRWMIDVDPIEIN